MILPKTINPIRMAQQSAQVAGELQLNQCKRLQALCDQAQLSATVSMDFSMDNVSHIPFICGNIATTINTLCQRCNALMTYSLDIPFLLSPVLTEQAAKNLPKAYEPLILDGETTLISELVEDEILLALPMVTRHADGECGSLATHS